MGYLIAFLILLSPFIYLFYLKRSRNKPTGRNAKEGAGYPSFDQSGGSFEDGNDAGPGNGPK